MTLIDIFNPGYINLIGEYETFPWESIVIEAQHLGYSVYLIFGNVVPINLRLIYTLLKRLGKKLNITIRRGFTYHQLLYIVDELDKYYDLVIFFHDPVSFMDLKHDEKNIIVKSIAISLGRYAGTLNSICIFSSNEKLNIPLDVKRIKVEIFKNGFMAESQGVKRYIYNDPRQISLDYFMEV